MASFVNGISTNAGKPTTSTGDDYVDRLRQATVSASQVDPNSTRGSMNARGGMNGMFNSGGITGRTDAGEKVKNTSATAWKNWASANTKTAETPRYGGGGGTVAPEWSGYNGEGGQDDVLAMIKDLLNQQKVASDNMYKSQYEQALANNRQSMENNRNQINLNYARGDRYLKGLYGDSLSGQGLSNRVRNNAVWQSSLASNRQNFANNNATALSQYNAGLANNASTLAQGWYNYVMPIYTNRQQNTDDYAYRRYLATL